MNFLAHQFLSFNKEPIMVGNFIADTVRGKQSATFPEGVRLGIEVHHHIDYFTDRHPEVRATRKLLNPYFGRYAAVVQDVFYDYFLVDAWDEYSDLNLSAFVRNVYRVLGEHADLFNERGKRTYYFMSTQNWLESYGTMEGIDRALTGMSHRAKYESNMENSIPALRKHRKQLKERFSAFFPELIQSVETEFNSRVEAIR